MNDQLKKYIEDNRDEFDHLEPSDAILFKIKDELRSSVKKKKTFLRLHNNTKKWMLAASILIVASATYLLFQHTTVRQTPDSPETVHIKPTTSTEEATLDNKKDDHPEAKKQIVKEPKLLASQVEKIKPLNKEVKYIDMSSVYAQLADSSSASTRLAAVLKIKESEAINNDIIDRLATTLNQDPNSNVRLAVLDLMGKYAQDSYVSQVFVQSLANQKDPLVQLGLINLLARTNDKRLDEKLYALANDPSTFTAVKDQAYLVLLNQNKL